MPSSTASTKSTAFGPLLWPRVAWRGTCTSSGRTFVRLPQPFVTERPSFHIDARCAALFAAQPARLEDGHSCTISFNSHNVPAVPKLFIFHIHLPDCQLEDDRLGDDRTNSLGTICVWIIFHIHFPDCQCRTCLRFVTGKVQCGGAGSAAVARAPRRRSHRATPRFRITRLKLKLKNER